MWRLLEKKIKQAYLVPAWMICVCECVYVWVSVCVSECVCVWGECSPEECLHTEGFTLWQVVRIDPCSRKLAYKVHKCMRAKSIQSCPTLWDPDGCSLPDSRLTLGFSRQEYWSGLPCFSRGSSWPQGLNLHLCLSLFLICCLTRDNHPEWYAFVVVVQSTFIISLFSSTNKVSISLCNIIKNNLCPQKAFENLYTNVLFNPIAFNSFWQESTFGKSYKND